MRKQHLREANELFDRLRRSGSKQESDEIHSHKVFMQCECFRKISKINKFREEMDVDLLSNSTPDDVSLFSEGVGLSNKSMEKTSFVVTSGGAEEQVSLSQAVGGLSLGAVACVGNSIHHAGELHTGLL